MKEPPMKALARGETSCRELLVGKVAGQSMSLSCHATPAFQKGIPPGEQRPRRRKTRSKLWDVQNDYLWQSCRILLKGSLQVRSKDSGIDESLGAVEGEDEEVKRRGCHLDGDGCDGGVGNGHGRKSKH